MLASSTLAPATNIINPKGQLFVPSDTSKYLDYSDKARKASDSEHLDSISSSSKSVDTKATTANQHLAAMDLDLDHLATISSQLTTISGKLDTIISKMPEQGA